jgi:hypothetical protein
MIPVPQVQKVKNNKAPYLLYLNIVINYIFPTYSIEEQSGDTSRKLQVSLYGMWSLVTVWHYI